MEIQQLSCAPQKSLVGIVCVWSLSRHNQNQSLGSWFSRAVMEKNQRVSSSFSISRLPREFFYHYPGEFSTQFFSYDSSCIFQFIKKNVYCDTFLTMFWMFLKKINEKSGGSKFIVVGIKIVNECRKQNKLNLFLLVSRKYSLQISKGSSSQQLVSLMAASDTILIHMGQHIFATSRWQCPDG